MENDKSDELNKLKDELEDERSFNDRLIMIFMLIIAFTGLFELGLMAVAFIFADHISCNLLWCTFTTIRSNEVSDTISISSSTSIVNQTQTCYQNGKLINCSDMNHISIPGYIP